MSKENPIYKIGRSDGKSSPSSSIITLVLAMSGAVVSLMQTLLVPLLPDLPKLIGVSADDASWLITATLLASAVATPSLTRLADMFGKRRMMFFSLTVMMAGSVVGAIAHSLLLLVIARAMQGFAMALIPIGISIMRDELPREKLGSAVALMSGTLGIGAAIGLPLSGFVYSHFGWHAVFWFSTGLAALSFLGVIWFVPESKVKTGGHFDLLGAVLLSISLAFLLLAITKGGVWGWSEFPTLGSFLISMVTLLFWIPWELRTQDPLVDLKTFSNRSVLFTNIASLLVGFAMYANMLTTTQLLQISKVSGYGFGISVLTAGMALLPAGLTMVAFAPVSAKITKEYGAERTLFIGALVLSLGYVARTLLLAHEWEIIAGAVVISAGTAIAYASMPTLIMGAVPISETSAANGVNTVLRTIGTATASAAIASLLSSNMLKIGAQEFPRLGSFREVYILAAVAAAISGGVTFLIPRKDKQFQ